MGVSLILLSNNGSIVIEIRAKSLRSSKILRAATIWRVLHIDGDTNITHQFCHGIFLLRRVRTIGVSGTHLLPSILRLRKISRARLTVISNGVIITSLTAQRPLMVVHDLSHRRGHTSRIVVGELIVRFALSPARFDKRGNGIGRFRGVRSLRGELGITFQLVVNISITLKQETNFWIQTCRIHHARSTISQHLSHRVVSGNNNETVSACIIIYIIRSGLQ